jgi:tetratricopeptide (TPR) repeat protein
MRNLKPLGIKTVYFLMIASTIVLFASSPKEFWLTNLGFLNLSKALIGHGDNHSFIESKNLFSEVLEYSRENRQAKMGLIASQINLGMAEQVQKDLAELSEQSNKPDLVFIAQWIIQASVRMSKMGKVEKSLQLAQLLDYVTYPGSAYVQIGHIYEASGQITLAEEYYLRATASEPEIASQSYLALGYLYLSQKRWNDAKEAFLESLDVYPANAYNAYWGLGLVAYVTGDPVPWFLKAADSVGPGHQKFMAYYYIGNIYGAWCGNKCQYHLAEKYYQLALMQQSSDTDSVRQVRNGLEIARQKIAQGLP